MVGVDESRKAIGSWIEGPRAGAEQMGADFGYRGKRLGLPEEGPGSIAGTGRRLAAVAIDWMLCYLIAYALIAGRHLEQVNIWISVLFFLVSVLTLATAGATPGKKLLGLRVVSLNGGRAGFGQVALRSFLLVLVVPALIWDRDGRGMHDKAVATVEVRV
ncbi:putative RDD family membrane protein YckC [Streptacidiphilus sp. MAP12-33]